MDSWLCQPSTLSLKHKTYKQLFQIKLETYCSLTRMVTPHKKLPKAQHGLETSTDYPQYFNLWKFTV